MKRKVVSGSLNEFLNHCSETLQCYINGKAKLSDLHDVVIDIEAAKVAVMNKEMEEDMKKTEDERADEFLQLATYCYKFAIDKEKDVVGLSDAYIETMAHKAVYMTDAFFRAYDSYDDDSEEF